MNSFADLWLKKYTIAFLHVLLAMKDEKTFGSSREKIFTKMKIIQNRAKNGYPYYLIIDSFFFFSFLYVIFWKLLDHSKNSH